MDQPLRLSAVLPCYEEAAHLEDVVRQLARSLDEACAGWEILLVVSTAAADNTPAVALALARELPGVRRVVQPSWDPGYGRALALGLAAARHRWVLLTDADGQFDHTELGRLVDRVPGADAVVGYRAVRSDPLPRRLAGAIYSGVVSALLGLRGVRDVDCAFKLLDRRTLGDAPLSSRTGVVNAELLRRAADAGARWVEVPVTHRPRQGGRTRFEMRLGILDHLPHPEEVWAMARDLSALLWQRHGPRPRGPETRST